MDVLVADCGADALVTYLGVVSIYLCCPLVRYALPRIFGSFPDPSIDNWPFPPMVRAPYY